MELLNAPPGQRPRAFDTLARLMYPPRGVIISEQDNGDILVTLFKWGYEYKHRGPKPKTPPPADCEGIREIIANRFPDVNITVEDHGPKIHIYIREVKS